jgi:hypothetical protein
MPTVSSLRLIDGSVWMLQPSRNRQRRRGAASEVDEFVSKLARSKRLELIQTSDLSPIVRRGGAATPRADFTAPVALETEVGLDELHVLLVRHASNAITFHLSSEVPTTLRRDTKKTVRFLVPLSAAQQETGAPRRGLVSRVVRTFLFKIAGVAADKALPALARAWEENKWGDRKEGWKQINAASLASKSLPLLTDFRSVSSDPTHPNLLFIHGTFSNALDAFRDLAKTRGTDAKTLFESLRDIYDDRIFAFDHFTVSKSLTDNIRDLISALPNRDCVFDVVTHSRGGLVLRSLIEMRESFGSLGSRFVLRRGVLVAAPNRGTPLATPARFDLFITWIANLMDLFPDNPFTEGIAFVSESLGWLAHRIAGALPGIAAMDSNGDEIHSLERNSDHGRSEYSAIVSNFGPAGGLLERMVDTGLDVFFGDANDLVVPTSGGWQADPGGRSIVAAAQIGCFGKGGNLQPPGEGAVSHITFFRQSETVDFLVRALKGEPQRLKPIDATLTKPLVQRRAFPSSRDKIPVQQTLVAESLSSPISPAHEVFPALRPRTDFTDEVFYLTVLHTENDVSAKSAKSRPEQVMLMASFRNARVVKMLRILGGEAGKRFQRIISVDHDIRNYVNGLPGSKDLPHGKRLIDLGRDLFETLFPGDIRRLYDVARAEQINRRINLIFTSQVGWLADLPYEFIYDPARETFLSVSEVNFTRNVSTAIPGDRFGTRTDVLRILVVVAQPLGLSHLSVEQETAVILSGFHRLIDAKLADVDVLLNASPSALHSKLESKVFDVIHFIGHGEYDPHEDLGYLIFEDDFGAVQRVDSDQLKQIVCRRGVRLVFLNACETGKGGRADFNRGVAPALIKEGVPAVVGNRYSVLDVSATAFARHFYWALALGRSIGDAAREARVAVNYLISGEAIDWAVPVMFARDPSERLTDGKVTPEILPSDATKESSGTRRSAEGRIKVAIWDVQSIVPNLDRIARTLTAAQSMFFFTAVSILAPLGTWRRDDKRGGEAFLDVTKVADRIKAKPKELGVEKLIAFTNLPMTAEGIGYTYSWEDPVREEIALFSTYDLLDQLEPPELSLERLIANAVVVFLADVNIHKRGRENCPGFYNGDRLIASIAGPLHFCRKCKNRIDRKTLDALDRLLKVYR